jgi:CHAT domain
MGRLPLVRIEQTSDGANVTLRAFGGAAALWPEDDNVIWQAPQTTVDVVNERLSQQLAALRSALGGATLCDATESGVRLGEYVRAVDEYWDKSETTTIRQIARRTELGDILTRLGTDVVKQARGDPLRAAKRAPVIEFVAGRQSPVPVEILPLGPRARAGEEVFDACSRLPAFSSVVQQVIHGSSVGAADPVGRALLPQGAIYEPRGRAFLRSTETKLWERMRDCLTEQQPPLVMGPAPASGVLDTGEKVARYLLKLDDLGQVDPGVSDIHVYAHGRQGLGFTDRFKIDFRYRVDRGLSRNRSFSVRALDIRDAIQLASEGPAHAHPPLIWLNCCTAAGEVGKELLSVSVDLARHGCTVIAPRTEVPEGVAVELAEQFYRYLAVHPVPGEALLGARLAMLCSIFNPLGILYVGLGRLV